MTTELRSFGPIEFEGFSLTGEYFYTAPIAPRYAADPLDSDPGEGAQVEIVSVYIDGGNKNAIELIAPSVVQWMEDCIAANLSDESDYDESNDQEEV